MPPVVSATSKTSSTVRVGKHISAALLLLAAGHAGAASFVLDTTSSTAQTLGSGANQTGDIGLNGLLSLGGGSNAVTITGTNATLTNLGTIRQTGDGRVVRDNTGVAGLTINNGSSSNAGALMEAADGDVIQVGKDKAGVSVTLNNYGTLSSLNASAGGAQAVDFAAIKSGANTINNFAGARIVAIEADAVRTGVNGRVINAGTIASTTPTFASSDGIDAQNNTGLYVLNQGLISGGRHGITGGPDTATELFTTTVLNQAGAIIRGSNGAGINLDGFNASQSASIENHGSITGYGITGDGDGIDVDGLVNLVNTGLIRSGNAYSAVADGLAYSEGITAGGGSITNSGTIEGLVAAGNTNAVGRGISLSGNDIGAGPLAGTREGLYGNTVVTNLAGGLIRGQSDSAIVVEGAASGYTVAINNNAGATLRGGGSGNAAVRTGADTTSITNAGLIDGSSSGKAIAMGTGINTLTIVGGQAQVLGDIDGGSGAANSMRLDIGAGNRFAYAGSIANFASVTVGSGNVSLTGVSSYTGTTVLRGGTLELAGADRLAAASSLELAGGKLEVSGAAGINGQTFAGLSLTDSSVIDLNASSLTFGALGSIVSGKTLTIVDYLSGGAGSYAFRLLGDYSSDASFLALLGATTIDGHAASFRVNDGYTYTYVGVSAVPEPESYLMFGAGLVLLGAIVRRRRNVVR